MTEKKEVKHYPLGGPTPIDNMEADIKALMKRGLFVHVKSIPAGGDLDAAEAGVTEKAPNEVLKFKEVTQAKFLESFRKEDGTGSGGMPANPKLQDSNVNADRFPDNDELPPWLCGDVPENCMIFSFESPEAYSKFLRLSDQNGLHKLDIYNSVRRDGKFYVLFRKLGTTPLSALDDTCAGPIV